MDQLQDAMKIHLGNIYNDKKKTQDIFKSYYFTVANANIHITYLVTLTDISIRTRLIVRL